MGVGLIHYYKKSLIDVFQRLVEIKQMPEESLEKSYQLQRILVHRIISIENRFQRNKNRIDAFKKTLGYSTSNDERVYKSKQINYLRDVNQDYKRIINIFKAVGDGLAFIYLNKWDIKPLVFKQSSGFISGKKGLRKELSILKGLNKDKKIAILNDITNCLRYGDITIPTEGFPILIEVKSSKTFSMRNKRQLEKANKVLNYLATDETEGLYEGIGTMKRVSLKSIEINYFKQLNDGIEIAFKDGYFISEIEEGLIYYIEFRPDIDNALEKVFTNVKKPFVYFINSAKHKNLGYYPFTLSIGNPERLYDFYAGDFLISVVVDLQVLIDSLLEYGLTVQYTEGHYPLEMRKDGSSSEEEVVKVSDHFLGRIGFEFWSLKSFIDELINKIPDED